MRRPWSEVRGPWFAPDVGALRAGNVGAPGHSVFVGAV